jgi:shikimate dehydrogenase
MPAFPIANRTKRVLLGLIGSPIAHSAAPAMHEAAAGAAGFELHYHLIDIAGAKEADLAAILDGVRRLGFSGLNITFPYKEAVIPLLDALAPEAAAMGAVNTIVARDGLLTGYNTDASGFATAYRALKRRDGARPSRSSERAASARRSASRSPPAASRHCACSISTRPNPRRWRRSLAST